MKEREDLRAEAVRILRQEIPEDLEWLPWSDLPAMRWRGDGAPVEAVVPRGWLVATALRRDPEPDGSLERQAVLFDRSDAAALASWLLRHWIEHDTAMPELTDARRAELRAIAERAAELARRFGRGGTDPEERYRDLVRQEEDRPAPSAWPHKGLLAVVAACADGTAVADIESYLATWKEERPEQCRALRQVRSRIADSA